MFVRSISCLSRNIVTLNKTIFTRGKVCYVAAENTLYTDRRLIVNNQDQSSFHPSRDIHSSKRNKEREPAKPINPAKEVNNNNCDQL